MNLSILLAEQIFVMGIMIFFGFAFTKLGLISMDDSSHISQLTLYIICPCLLIDSFQIDFSYDKMMGFFLAIGAAILIHIFIIPLSMFAGKIFHLDQMEQASIIYSNAGNLIVPIIGYVLGDEYVFYCAAFMSVQSSLIWTHGLSLISGRKTKDMKKILLNPNMIAIILGLILFFTGIKLPSMLADAVDRTGACIGPVSMIIIGILIASSDLKEVFTRGKSWLVVFLRLIVCPTVVILVIWILHLPSLTAEAPKILFASFLASAAPQASTVTQMANVHHKNEILAGSINIMSVLLCIITMPLMTLFYQMLCMH